MVVVVVVPSGVEVQLETRRRSFWGLDCLPATHGIGKERAGASQCNDKRRGSYPAKESSETKLREQQGYKKKNRKENAEQGANPFWVKARLKSVIPPH